MARFQPAVDAAGSARLALRLRALYAAAGWSATMPPKDIQQIGEELAILWEDGSESFIPLEALRRRCPCAGCQGETDVMGTTHRGPGKPLRPEAFQLRRIANVGGYAIQPVWGDGHATGLYSFEYLRRVAAPPPE